MTDFSITPVFLTSLTLLTVEGGLMYCHFPSHPLFILSAAKNDERAGSRQPEANSRKPTAGSPLTLPLSHYPTSTLAH